MHDLALHQSDVERARLEPGHVLGAALGVDRLDLEPGIGATHAFDEGRAIDRKAAAWRGGAEGDLHGLSFRGPRRGDGGSQDNMSAQRHGGTISMLLNIGGDIAERVSAWSQGGPGVG